MLTDCAKELCQKELDVWTSELQQIISAFGEEKTEQMLSLIEEFSSTAQDLKGIK